MGSDPRLCIVGAGKHSTGFVHPKIGKAGAELAGVCDIDREKAERNARRFGGHPYVDMDEMLDAEDPDGVIIVIGPEAHAELAPKVMRRGIPVYTEKPPALTADSAYNVAQVSQETGVMCVTGMKQRYSKAYSRAKEWIESFEPEEKNSLMLHRGLGHFGSEGREMLDPGIHPIDLIQYLFGDVNQVCTFSRGENAYAVTMEFEDGATGTFTITSERSMSVPSETVEITMDGGNFMTIENSSRWRITENEEPAEWREPPVWISVGDLGHETGLLTEIEEFVQAIQEDRTMRSSIFETYKSMELFEAIMESAETNQPAEVTYRSL